MSRIPVVSMLVLILCICGCARKLPEQREGYGLVAQPFKYINRTEFSHLYALEMKCSANEAFSFRIEPQPYNDGLVVSPPLAAGDYIVDTLVLIHVSEPGVMSDSRREVQKIKKPFTLPIRAGRITLIPSLLTLEQEEQGKVIRTRIDSKALDEDGKAEYQRALSAMENGGQWQVFIPR